MLFYLQKQHINKRAKSCSNGEGQGQQQASMSQLTVKVLVERKPEGGVVGMLSTITAGSPSPGPHLTSSLVSLTRPYEKAPPASSLANLVPAYSYVHVGKVCTHGAMPQASKTEKSQTAGPRSPSSEGVRTTQLAALKRYGRSSCLNADPRSRKTLL